MGLSKSMLDALSVEYGAQVKEVHLADAEIGKFSQSLEGATDRRRDAVKNQQAIRRILRDNDVDLKAVDEKYKEWK